MGALRASNAIADLASNGEGINESLLRVSLQLFSTQGFRATSVRDIARALGMSVSAMYYYAASKEALLSELMRLDLRWLIERARGALSDARDPARQIQALVHTHVIRDEDGMHLLVLSDSEIRSVPAEDIAEIVALRDAYEELWRETISAGVGQGVFRVDDPKLAAFALLDMCNGVARWFSPKGELSIEEIASRLAQYAINLLTAQASGSQQGSTTWGGRQPGSNIYT